VQFTTRGFAAQHPDVVAKFVRASIRGWQQYLHDPAPTNALLLTLNPALNPAQVAYTAEALRDVGFINGGDISGAQAGRMTAARWTAGYEQLKSLDILDGPLDPLTAYSLQFAQ
jgi:NitT/TauT family transport system substrate-binding protein